jgi:hypothetical protein
MTEPTHLKVQDRSADRFGLDIPDESLLPDTPAAKAAKEPLFNKKVMFVWAFGAFAVWFAIHVVVPIAFESAKVAIREAIEQAGQNSRDGKTKVIILPNGRRITITSDGPRIGPEHPSTTVISVPTPAEPAIAPVAGTPAPPAEPAKPAVPAKKK